MRIDLPSGGWVDVIPIQDLKGKHRSKLNACVNTGVPYTEDADLDRVKIDAMPGGYPAFNEAWKARRQALTAAIVITAWSYDPLPIPSIDEGTRDVVNAASMDEVGLDVFDAIEPHLRKLSRDPNPKGLITSTPTGPSKEEPAGQTE